MILAIDVGNTNIVLGCIEDGAITNIVRVQTNTRATEAEYAIQLLHILELYGVDRQGFESAIVSSVVPPVTEALMGAVKRVTGCQCIQVTPSMDLGITIAVDEPASVAGDLLVGAVAAAEAAGVPCIVLDMGTASTLTVIDRDRRFLGGAIIPGVKLSYEALAAGTSLLPDIYITPPSRCVASNTVDCMRSGAVFGTAAMIDGMIDRMEAEMGEKCKLIATGGLARCVTPYCKHQIQCDDELLLKGLWTIYKKSLRQ